MAMPLHSHMRGPIARNANSCSYPLKVNYIANSLSYQAFDQLEYQFSFISIIRSTGVPIRIHIHIRRVGIISVGDLRTQMASESAVKQLKDILGYPFFRIRMVFREQKCVNKEVWIRSLAPSNSTKSICHQRNIFNDKYFYRLNHHTLHISSRMYD